MATQRNTQRTRGDPAIIQRPTPTASNAQYFDALRKRRDSPAEFNTTPRDPQSRLVPKNLVVAATEHQTQHPTPRGRPCHHPTPNSRHPTPSTPNAHGHPAPEGTPRPCSGASTRMAHRPAHPHGCKPGDLAVAPTAVAPVAAPRHEHRIAMAPPVRGRPCRPCAAASKPDGTPQGMRICQHPPVYDQLSQRTGVTLPRLPNRK
ncbi:hypothetical protein K3495_g13737 [Podosphaera aphanis]|nr:hypothetical protein K3495_g13737 [Podosphaera aphanis]